MSVFLTGLCGVDASGYSISVHAKWRRTLNLS